MIPLAIAFPVFDPVAIAIGPFAIRWYALAYICGILLGWLYARAVIRRPALWGGQSPVTLVQMDDFILWVTLGIILGGRLGYVLFYNFEVYSQKPLDIFRLWDGGMSLHGGVIGVLIAVIVGMISLDSAGEALIAGGAYFALTAVEGQLITPWFVGRSLQLNTVVVFVSVTLWAWLWSVTGMLLATPLLVMIRTLCEHIPVLESFGNFLSARGVERPPGEE